MELSKMLAMVDHTLLKPEATWAQIQQICDDAMKYHTATVCIPASYVARCKAYMQDRADKVGVCTVIGFPTGYSTTAAKVFEAADAVKNGADEVSDYAREAMGWAVDAGLITGVNGTDLEPGGTAWRASMAEMVKRYSSF